jgi:hypothetical protein
VRRAEQVNGLDLNRMSKKSAVILEKVRMRGAKTSALTLEKKFPLPTFRRGVDGKKGLK